MKHAPILSLFLMPLLFSANYTVAQTLGEAFTDFEVKFEATVKIHSTSSDNPGSFSEHRINEKLRFSKSTITTEGSKNVVQATHRYNINESAYFLAVIDTVSMWVDSIASWRKIDYGGINYEQARVVVHQVPWLGSMTPVIFDYGEEVIESVGEFTYYYHATQTGSEPELNYWFHTVSTGLSDTSKSRFASMHKMAGAVKQVDVPETKLRAWSSGDEIILEGADGEIRIFDLLGRLVQSGLEVRFGGMQPGVYVVVSGGKAVQVLVEP